MSMLLPGQYAYVSYEGEADLWHVRLVLAWVEGSEYVIITPDFDIYIEALAADNEDLSGIRLAGVGGEMPFGLAGQRIHDFARRPGGGDLQNVLAEGRRLAGTERLARNLVARPDGGLVPATVVAPDVVPVAAGVVGAAARVVPVGGMWVLDEPCQGFSVGDEVDLPDGSADFGGRTFVAIGGHLAAVRFLAAGTERTEAKMARVAELMASDCRVFPRPLPGRAVTLAQLDADMVVDPDLALPFSGPATMGDGVRNNVARGMGSFSAEHDRWIVEGRIDPHHRSAYEHKVLSRTLQLAVEEGLNIKNLASMEYVQRRRQLLQVAHRDDPAKPSFEGAHLYMGESDDRSGAHLSSALRAHVAAEFGKEAAIEKEKRKAREARNGTGDAKDPKKKP
jgi:hypothetical protein